MYNCFVLVLLGLCTNCYGQAAVDELLRNYDARESPADAGHGSTEVRIGMYVNSIYYDENEKELKLRLYSRESWQDERLRFVAQNGKDMLRVDPRDHSKVWYPDNFFRQAIRVEGYEEPTQQAITRLNTTGHVWRVRSYTTDTMTLGWLDSPVNIDSEYASIGPTKMNMVDKILHDCTQTYSAGTFPCLELKFVLKMADESSDESNE